MLKGLSLRSIALERALGLRFKNQSLLRQALVHPSYLNEAPSDLNPIASYERLEFLGDAVLGVTITSELFTRCPDFLEGQLTKLRSSLVRGKTLAKVAREIGLGQHLKFGKGEESTGGRDRESNLAAALEALIGAVFVDRGFSDAKKLVLKMMRAEIEGLLSEGVPEDPKSRLQELVQRMGGVPPRYQPANGGGSSHSGFDIQVMLDGKVMGEGHGNRKVDAEKQAAQEALRRLESQKPS